MTNFGLKEVEEFRDASGGLLATVVRFRPGFDGSRFFTRPEDLLQVGMQRMPAGKVIPRHRHQPVERETVGTAEVLLVMDGRVRVSLGPDDGRDAAVELAMGDFIVLQPACEHGVVAIEETRLWECKSGPYESREVDKG